MGALTDRYSSTTAHVEKDLTLHTLGHASSRGPSLGAQLLLGISQTARVIITPVLKELQPEALAAEHNTPHPCSLSCAVLGKGGAHKRLLSRNLGNIYHPYMPHKQPLCDHGGWFWLLEVNNIVCLDKKSIF